MNSAKYAVKVSKEGLIKDWMTRAFFQCSDYCEEYKITHNEMLEKELNWFKEKIDNFESRVMRCFYNQIYITLYNTLEQKYCDIKNLELIIKVQGDEEYISISLEADAENLLSDIVQPV